MSYLVVKSATFTSNPYGKVTITSTPSSNVLIKDTTGSYSGVYRGTVSGTVALGTIGTVVYTVANFSIRSSGSNVLVDNQNALLSTDTVTVTATGTDSSSGTTVATPVKISISNAGQTYVSYI